MIVLSKSIPIRISSADLSFGLPVRVRTAFGFTGCSEPKSVSAISLWTGTHREQVLRHRMETGMHDLVIHRKHNNRGEILLQQNFELLAALAVTRFGPVQFGGIRL